MLDVVALLEKLDTSVAVVGATDDSNKYGHVIYQDLKQKGFEVYPINPNRTSVDGDNAYKHLKDIPEKPTLVNFVVPPSVTMTMLRECLQLNLMNVWLQPGSESPESMAFLQQHSFNYLANACIMLSSRLKG